LYPHHTTQIPPQTPPQFCPHLLAAGAANPQQYEEVEVEKLQGGAEVVPHPPAAGSELVNNIMFCYTHGGKLSSEHLRTLGDGVTLHQ
jgi:hypothetical protein